MQLSFGAERIDNLVHHHGHRTRTGVEAEVVVIRRGIRVPPLRRAGGGVERLEHFLVLHAVEDQDARADDDRTGEALSDGLAPYDLRTAGSPGVGDRRSLVDAVALWAE